MGRLTGRYYDVTNDIWYWGIKSNSTNDGLVATPQDILDKLAHYEDLEEQGRLIEVVRCKDCAMESTCVHTQYQGEDGYCSMAELKELKGE